MFRWLILVTFSLGLTNAIVYDCYHGTPATHTQIKKFAANGKTDACTIDIQPCDENEVRRLDGSCYNLKYPASGGYHTPQAKMIPAEYGEGYEPRKTKSGKPMMLARALREKLYKVGHRKSRVFTHAMGLFAEFLVNDLISVHDTTTYVEEIMHCCKEDGKTDYMCTPNMIPEDDPMYHLSNYRCINQTRPKSYQNQGCTSNNTAPKRINFATVPLDLSNLYYFETNIDLMIRTFKGGLLKSEIVNGREFASDGNVSCTIEQANKVYCTRHVPNGVIGSNMITTWFWRQHNLFARELSKVNPTWDDDKLFYTAREMNIAFYLQMKYYEFWVLTLGRENMLEQGIISEDPGFRDIYDQDLIPTIFEEYLFGCRWFHTLQAGVQRMYDENYKHVGNKEMTSFAFQVHKLAIDDDFPKLTRGMVFDAGDDTDDVIDPLMAEVALTPLQNITDVFTQDFNKGRYMAFASYNKYRDLRTNYKKSHNKFDDFTPTIPAEKVDILKELYECADDVELMAGIGLENFIEGGYVPDTVAFFIFTQLKQSIKHDRFWYERADRPHPFTREQLQEIRKANLAALLCNVADGITHIQRQAFLLISEENPMVSCSDIPYIDFTAWKEERNESECKSFD